MLAFIRGFSRHSAQTIGNFWVDMTRSVLYVLLPLSFILAFRSRKVFGPSAMEQAVKSIQNKYGERIVELKDLAAAPAEALALNSIDDLVKITNEMIKPIFHQSDTSSGIKHSYYVLDGATCYIYLME
jgi:hypothetical protein